MVYKSIDFILKHTRSIFPETSDSAMMSRSVFVFMAVLLVAVSVEGSYVNDGDTSNVILNTNNRDVDPPGNNGQRNGDKGVSLNDPGYSGYPVGTKGDDGDFEIVTLLPEPPVKRIPQFPLLFG